MFIENYCGYGKTGIWSIVIDRPLYRFFISNDKIATKGHFANFFFLNKEEVAKR